MTPGSLALGLSTFLVVGAAITGTPASAASTTYRVVPILPKGYPTQQFGSVIPRAINSAGVVVGWQIGGANTSSATSPTGRTVGFVWSGAATRPSDGLWNALNDSSACGGYVIGTTNGSAATGIQAVVVDCVSDPNGRLLPMSSNAYAQTYLKIPLATQQGIPEVLALNASGQFAGQQAIRIPGARPIFCTRAFSVTAPNVVQDLSALPNGCNSAATAINASGAIVGWSELVTGSTSHHAVRWQGTTPVDIGTFGGAESEAVAITDGGQAVGAAQTSQQTWHVAVWAAGSTQPRDLGTLGGAESRAIAVFGNRILGKSQTANGAWHAFIYDLDANKVSDVNDLLPANSGWILNEAHAMNSKGTIVGVGMLNNATTAFALSPFSVATLNASTPAPILQKPITVAPH